MKTLLLFCVNNEVYTYTALEVIYIKWRWLTAFVICITILLVNSLHFTQTKELTRKVVLSNEDLIWLRAEIKKVIPKDEKIIPVSIQTLLPLSSIEPFEDGFLFKTTSPTVRAFSSGIILFTGNTKKYGKLMTVYYDLERLYVTIGQLYEIKQLPYVTVKSGDILGTLTRNRQLFIKLERDGEVLSSEETVRWLSLP